MNRRVVVYGAGNLAGWVCPEIALCDGMEVTAFVADDPPGGSRSFLGLPLSEFASVEERYPSSEFDMLVLTGHRRMRDRRVTFEQAKEKGYRLASFVSPRAITCPDLVVGENVVIGPGAHVGPGCRIGSNVVICQCAHVGSKTEVKDHCYIAGRAAIGGLARLEELCFIGMNATIVDRAVLGTETFVAAGAVVGRTTEPFSQYVGNPAIKRGEHRDTGMVFFG